MLGKKHTEESKRKNANAHRNHTYNLGRIHTKQSRFNMSKAHLGNIPWNLGKKVDRIICPHCGLVGGENAMKRYHFNNCKKIKW